MVTIKDRVCRECGKKCAGRICRECYVKTDFRKRLVKLHKNKK